MASNSSLQFVFETKALMISMMGNITHVDDDKAEYSASNVDNAISVCKNDF